MTDTPAPKPRKRRLRVALIVVAAVLVVIIGAVATVVATFDPNTLKPRIQEAVQEATGRELTLNGAIGLKLSLWPTVEIQDVALSNPPGFSRPQVATLQSLELRLGLIPLLSSRVEIQRLVLVRPNIVLETNAKGEPNWNLTPPATPAADGAGASTPSAPQAASPQAGPPAGPSPHVAMAEIKDGTLVWRDGDSGRTVSVAVPNLTVRSESPTAPLRLTAGLRVNNADLTIKAEAGSWQRLLHDANVSVGASGAPMPLSVVVTAGAATIQAEGTITHPIQGKGYALAVSATIPDTDALFGVLPPGLLPASADPNAGPRTIGAARDVVLSARVTDAAGPMPTVTDLTLRSGAVTLRADTGGVRIEKVEISAPAPSQPITLAVGARLDDLPLTIAGTLGHPGFVAPGFSALPIDLRATAGGATATAKGTIAKPADLSGVTIDLTARIPDLSALTPLARRPLPPLKTIAFQGHLVDGAGGLTKGMAIKAMSLTIPEADLAGEASLGLGMPRSVTAALRSNRVDVDALRAILAKPPPAAEQPVANAAAPPASSAPPARPARSDRLIPDDPIPFGMLQMVDADLRLRVGTLRFDASDFKAIDAHLVIDDGKLRLDPFTAQAPEGRMHATLTADANQPAPPVHLTARSPGITLRGILAAMGVRPMAAGQVEMVVDVRGAGETPRALAASLNGMVGVAMAGGTIDTRILGGSVGKVSKDLALLDLLGRSGGTAEIRCLAVRFDARDGLARARTLLLSSSLLTADGGGSVNLRDETVNLLFRPQGRVGGTGFRVPVRVSGPIRSARVEVDASGAAEANIDTLAGIVIGGDKQLGAVLGGLLGTDRVGSDANACPTALALARGGTAPPPGAREQAPPAPTPTQPKPRAPDPGQLLRQLFR